MNQTLISAKKECRARLRAAIAAMPPSQKALESRGIRDQLLAQSLWQQARSVLLFAAKPDEPDLSPLLIQALDSRKDVALPRYDPETDDYNAGQVLDPAADLQPGPFDTRQPIPSCPTVPLHELDLILVPGLGFSPDGSRLGRGKGYFDRLLARTQAHTCGVAFECQVVLAVPAESHDIRLHFVVTPTRWLECQKLCAKS